MRSLTCCKHMLVMAVVQLLVMPAFSQKSEAEIEQLVRDFSKAYENVVKSRDKESVLRYVSRDLFSTIVRSDVVDNFGLIQSTYDDFDAHLDHLLEQEAMTIKYTIREILRSRVRGRTGVVVCDIDLQIAPRGEIWNKGNEIVTFTLKQFDDNWKIVFFNVVNLEEVHNKGTCLVEIYMASSGNYVAKTVTPGGNRYTTNFNSLEFSRSRGQININLDGEPAYSWQRDGPVTRIAQAHNPEREIGHAIDETAAVVLIVQNLYEKSCTEYRRK